LLLTAIVAVKSNHVGDTGRDGTPERRSWRAAGGGGGQEGWHQELWVPALPESGTVTFACTWEARGIVDATAELEAKKLLSAAKRARPIFSES
jgi:hypothetical protein